MTKLFRAIRRLPTLPRAENGFRLLVAAIFAVLVVTLCLLGLQIQLTSTRYVRETRAIAHSRDVQVTMAEIVAEVRATEADLRGFVLSNDPTYLDAHVISSDGLRKKLQELEALVADSSAEKANADALIRLIEAKRESMNSLRRVYVASGADAARAEFVRAAPYEQTQAILQLVSTMLVAEGRVLTERRAQAAATASSTRQLGTIAVAICLFELTCGFWLLWRGQRRRAEGQALLERSNADLAATLATSRRLADSMRSLSEFGEMLQGCRNVDEAISGVRSALVHVLPDCAGTLNVINASQNFVEAVTSWGAHAIETSPLFVPDDCWALRRGQPFPPAQATHSFTCKHVVLPDPSCPQAAYLCVPLVANGEIFGVLHLTSAREIGTEMRGIAFAAAEQISLTFANLKLQDSLRTQSLRDPLTGLFNRRYLESSLEREVLRAQRHNLSFAVLMLDLDDFKHFNDEHGHDAGDALLSEFGRLLLRSLRNEDIVCRYGGEEFIAILVDADVDTARQRADGIRTETQCMEYQHRHEPFGRLTVSIGIAMYPTHGTVPADLLHCADKALYKSKHGGKDRVTVASHVLVLNHPAGRGDA